MATRIIEDPLAGNSKYRSVRSLGHGAFGHVYLAESTEGEQVAIKLLKRSNMTKYAETEIINHSTLWHPHVIQFREVFLTREHLCIVMEYANSGTLFNYVQVNRRLPETEARWYFQQVVLAVDYCQRKGIANRDIKLENVLMHKEDEEGTVVKICDFGYSKSSERSNAKSVVGTITYMAPEVLLNRAAYNGMMVDVWSCGVMLYVMLFGAYPFKVANTAGVPTAEEISHVVEQMQGRAYPLLHNDVSPDCLSLLHRMLEPEPSQRVTVQDIMSDPWFVCGLPGDVQGFNAMFLELEPEEYPRAQGPADIRAVVAQACMRHGGGLLGL